MAIYKRFSPSIVAAFSTVIMIVMWLVFAPTQVGGMASYIVIIGKSMEPNFHIGDLVVVHREPAYQVGDAIVYRNLDLDSFVFHRIASEQLGHYVLKGDNNAWVDTYQPAREEILGKLWLYVPRGGETIQKMRRPINMAFTAAILGIILVLSLFQNKSKGNSYMNTKSFRERFSVKGHEIHEWLTQINKSEPSTNSESNQAELLNGMFFILGMLSLSSLLLGIISFSKPASRISQDDIHYEHLGVFSYAASTPQGVYDQNALKSGDPIFTRLTCSMDVNFQYSLIAPEAKNISGTYQLTAMIREQTSGWQRQVPLQEKTAFSGNVFGTTAKVDLCKMESLMQALEQGTDFHPGSYLLLITPNIKINGEISGHPLESSFNSALNFQYDRVHFYLVKEEEAENPLSKTESGLLHEQRVEANTLILFGRELAIPTLRLVTIVVFVVSLVGFIVLGFMLNNWSHSNQEKFFRIKYASLMVDIRDTDSLSLSLMTDVNSIDDLAKLAARFNTMILHAGESSLPIYYVQGTGITYRFAINADKTAAAIPEFEASGHGGGEV